MNARQILDEKGHEVATIRADKAIKDAMAELIGNRVGSLVVVGDDDSVIGIITERDIFRLGYRENCRIMDISIADVMTRDVIIALPDDNLEYLRSLITENRIRHLPVMDGGKLIGLISIGDVLRHQSREMHVTVRFLKDYIEGAYPG